MTTSSIPTPATLAPPVRPAFDRFRWERALLSAQLPHHNSRLLGWGLAHLAGPAGYLPPGGPQDAERLANTLHLTGKQVRLSLAQLEAAGLISRPDIHTWQPRNLVRPITLTMPSRPSVPESPSPGGRP